jgi:hypothetical protein
VLEQVVNAVGNGIVALNAVAGKAAQHCGNTVHFCVG